MIGKIILTIIVGLILIVIVSSINNSIKKSRKKQILEQARETYKKLLFSHLDNLAKRNIKALGFVKALEKMMQDLERERYNLEKVRSLSDTPTGLFGELDFKHDHINGCSYFTGYYRGADGPYKITDADTLFIKGASKFEDFRYYFNHFFNLLESECVIIERLQEIVNFIPRIAKTYSLLSNENVGLINESRKEIISFFNEACIYTITRDPRCDLLSRTVKRHPEIQKKIIDTLEMLENECGAGNAFTLAHLKKLREKTKSSSW